MKQLPVVAIDGCTKPNGALITPSSPLAALSECALSIGRIGFEIEHWRAAPWASPLHTWRQRCWIEIVWLLHGAPFPDTGGGGTCLSHRRL
jgi:hypothetical protein